MDMIAQKKKENKRYLPHEHDKRMNVLPNRFQKSGIF